MCGGEGVRRVRVRRSLAPREGRGVDAAALFSRVFTQARARSWSEDVESSPALQQIHMRQRSLIPGWVRAGKWKRQRVRTLTRCAFAQKVEPVSASLNVHSDPVEYHDATRQGQARPEALR